MYRKFIATIAALSVAITALGSTPAAADDKEIARTLAAIAGIAIMGKIIYDKNKERDREREREIVTRRAATPVYEAPRYYARVSERPRLRPRADLRRHTSWEPRDRDVTPVIKREVRPLPERVNSKLLPQQCFRSFDSDEGKVMMFGERCLEQNYANTDRLPTFCAKRIRTDDGAQYGYDARCLRDSGYSLARR